jgi:hypothetical protein
MKLHALVVGTCISAVPSVAGATLLNPGNNGTPAGESLAGDPNLAGHEHDPPQSFRVTCGELQATVFVSVVQETNFNTLDFYYRVLNESATVGIFEVRATDYSVCGSVDADYRSDQSGNVDPTNVALDMTGKVSWFFMGPSVITPGQVTQPLIVHTQRMNSNNNGVVTLTSTSGVECAIAGTWNPI